MIELKLAILNRMRLLSINTIVYLCSYLSPRNVWLTRNPFAAFVSHHGSHMDVRLQPRIAACYLQRTPLIDAPSHSHDGLPELVEKPTLEGLSHVIGDHFVRTPQNSISMPPFFIRLRIELFLHLEALKVHCT